MKVFNDLICDKCEYIIEDEFINTEASYMCPKCGEELRARVGYGSFKLVFNQKTDLCDWSGNRNKYWDAVKQSRSEGRKVKGCNEN